MSAPEARGTVLLVLHEGYGAGGSIAALRMLPHLRRLGWRFAIWVDTPSRLADRLREEGHDVAGAPRHMGWSAEQFRHPPGPAARIRSLPAWFRGAERFAAEREAVLVHANSIMSVGDAVHARLRGRRSLLHVHEMPPDPRKGRIAAGGVRRAGIPVVAVSEASAAPWRAGGCDVSLVHASAPLPPVTAVRRRPRDAPPVVGTMGWISRRKGSDLFVAAADLVRRARPDVEFRHAGTIEPGPGQEEARELAAALEAGGVRCLGQIRPEDELPDWDVFVLPSRSDPFPLVVLEAMGCAVPVVVTDVDGMPEQVAQDCGLVVPPESPSALADAILALLDDPDRRATLGARGRERVAAHFVPERSAAALDAVYRRLLSGDARRSER